jgi:hypothetical protein
VDGNGASCGAYQLNVTPYISHGASNEAYATAYAIGDVSTRSAAFTGDTCPMGNDYSDSTSGCGASATSGDSVFSFTLAGAGTHRVIIDTVGSAYDTVISLRSSTYAVLACDNDTGIGVTGGASKVTADLTAGTYYVIVDGKSGACGPYALNVQVSNATSSAYVPPTWAQATAALNARNIKVIVVESSGRLAANTPDANAACEATHTVQADLSPMVYRINPDGSGLGATLVTAIEDIAEYTRMDISAHANDNPSTISFDESSLVSSIVAMGFGPGNCTGFSGGVFNQCTPGTTVNFQVNYTGLVAATIDPQRFDFTIDILGNGTSILSTIPVTIIIPPIAPAFPVSGTYFRDYDATASCAGTEVARWGGLSWSGTFPAGTSITWSLQSAASAAGLGAATPVSTTVTDSRLPASAWNTGDALLAAFQPATLPFMRVTATLHSNATRSDAPTLSSFNILFDCLPGT